MFVHRHGHDETVVVISVISEHFEPTRCRDNVRGRLTEMLFKERLNVLHEDAVGLRLQVVKPGDPVSPEADTTNS